MTEQLHLTIGGMDRVSLPERKPRPKPHKVHVWKCISWCPNCSAPLLYSCSFTTSRGRPCIETRTERRHICPVQGRVA